jgi:hypothetical protein
MAWMRHPLSQKAQTSSYLIKPVQNETQVYYFLDAEGEVFQEGFLKRVTEHLGLRTGKGKQKESPVQVPWLNLVHCLICPHLPASLLTSATSPLSTVPLSGTLRKALTKWDIQLIPPNSLKTSTSKTYTKS